MANATFVKSAQKDIYENGKHVEYKSEKGKRAGQMLTKLDRTVPRDEKDKIFIAKGESYYWWQFKNGPKNISKERPKPSQLTQSAYLSQLYNLQDRQGEIQAECVEDLESWLEDFKSEIETLKEETESSLENMPEGLQSSPTGELLQERIDALDSAYSDLDNIDVSDYEEPEEDTIIEEIREEEGNDEYDPSPEEIAEKKQEKLTEWLDEKINEIQGVSLD